PGRARESVSSAERLLESAAGQADSLISETAMLRVLGSVGTQMAAFVHEVTGLVAAAEAVEIALDRVASDQDVDDRTRKLLLTLRRSTSSLRQGLDRQASYLVDVLTRDARRRRSRQPLSQRVSAAVDLLNPAIGKRRIQ